MCHNWYLYRLSVQAVPVTDILAAVIITDLIIGTSVLADTLHFPLDNFSSLYILHLAIINIMNRHDLINKVCCEHLKETKMTPC